jgi:hypothetical protein
VPLIKRLPASSYLGLTYVIWKENEGLMFGSLHLHRSQGLLPDKKGNFFPLF